MEQDTEAEKTLRAALMRTGVKIKDVSVLGKDRKKVYLSGDPDNEGAEQSEGIRKVISETLKTEYSAATEGIGIMNYSPEKTMSVKVYCAKETKDGETVSGDNVLFGELREGVFYAMLSDGMGSGASAGRSKVVPRFLSFLKTRPCKFSICTDFLFSAFFYFGNYPNGFL